MTKTKDHGELVADALQRIREEFGLEFQSTCYACPVQLEIDEPHRYIYFRARGTGWQFEVARDESAWKRDEIEWERSYAAPDPELDAIMARPDSDEKWRAFAEHNAARMERPGAFAMSWLSGDALYEVLAECIREYQGTFPEETQ